MPMERVSVARMATAKLLGWIHAALGMGVPGAGSSALNSYRDFDYTTYRLTVNT
jgi:hypothetical protein